MTISYDYDELLNELRKEVSDGILSMLDSIQVLRGEPLADGYMPIIDWYYSDDRMQSLIAEDESVKADYEIDRPNLKNISVAIAIDEMKRKNKLI